MSKIGTIPLSVPPDVRMRLSEMKSAIEALQPNEIPPDTVTNVVVTPIGGGNQITFTRAQNASSYILRISVTPLWNPASDMQRDLGDSNVAEDFTGAGSVTRYYSVLSKNGNLFSQPSVPKSGTSLAPGTSATLPTPPPTGQNVTMSDETQTATIIEPRGAAKLR